VSHQDPFNPTQEEKKPGCENRSAEGAVKREEIF
jgi:hypothetical protein